MDFLKELKLKQNIIEENLEKIINRNIAPGSIIEAMKYSLLAPGKRVRPILAITICEALGGKAEDVLNLGCAIEIIHSYSLIHDDLPAMDNDDLRRGKPTNHKVYGEAMAILAGDGLLNYSFEIIFDEIIKNNFNPSYVMAGEVISKSSGINGMIGGQVLDMENENKLMDLNSLYEMHEKKTGALIEAACLIGYIISGNIEKKNSIMNYSKNLGIAFQIIDDILDCTGDVKKLGKNIGSDFDNGKSTFVSILGLDKSIKLAREYSAAAKSYAKEIEADSEGFLANLTDYLLNREC